MGNWQAQEARAVGKAAEVRLVLRDGQTIEGNGQCEASRRVIAFRPCSRRREARRQLGDFGDDPFSKIFSTVLRQHGIAQNARQPLELLVRLGAVGSRAGRSDVAFLRQFEVFGLCGHDPTSTTRAGSKAGFSFVP
jgi:hypothetical protein